ncbi:metallophosphoesterase [Paracoccus rhizosphaerae]|uniref:Metallophosphoesterase n=1 Tax=Paracoccus rhizosphaerae TaxID=1133347 RepID=A0ABV6CGJ2_9RHOB|nr:metallophosphoesterase [Paracoccus rhizosphaerae]
MLINEFSREVLTFHAMTLSLGLIVAGRFVPRLSLPSWLRWGLAGLAVVVSVRYLVSQLISGSTDTLEVPRPVLVAINWLFAFVLLLAIAQVALDVVTLLRSIIFRRWRRPAGWVRPGIGLAALGLAAVGVSQALRVPPPRIVPVVIRGLPDALEGYRILQLTDLHISPLFDRDWVAGVVEVANRQQADVIVITGDLVEGAPADRLADVAPLRQLQAPDGVFMSPGNHEYYFDYDTWMEIFRDLGIVPMVNNHRVIGRHDAALVLAGVPDPTALALGLPGPDLAAALAAAPQDAPAVLLDHRPARALDAAAAGVDLQLSGHTHGGMIGGLGGVAASLNGGFVAGRYDVGGMTLYVSRGTALASGFAVRLGVPSEMTVLELTGGS